jgi:hypothetical protein
MQKKETNEKKILIIFGHRYCSQANLLRATMDQNQVQYE